MQLLNPFVPSASFLYPLKTTENHKVFLSFQEVEKEGALGTNGLGFNLGTLKLVWPKSLYRFISTLNFYINVSFDFQNYHPCKQLAYQINSMKICITNSCKYLKNDEKLTFLPLIQSWHKFGYFDSDLVCSS